MADPEPPRQDAPRLGPREHPRDGPEVLDGALARPRGRPRAEVQVLDHSDRSRGLEVLQEALGLEEVAIGVAGGLGHAVHGPDPFVRNRLVAALEDAVARADLGVHHLFEVPLGDPRVRVLLGDGLALLGELDRPRHRLVGQGQQRAVHRAASPRDRAAPAVEQPQVDAVVVGGAREAHLVAVERPVRREEAVLLVGVGVAQHHLLGPTAGLEVAGVGVVLEEGTDDPGGPLEGRLGLEQRHDVEARVVGERDDVGLIGEEEHLEDVARLLGHADAVGVDGGLAELGLPAGERVEEIEHLRAGLGEPRPVAEIDHGRVLEDGLGEHLDAPGLVHRGVVDALALEDGRDGVGVAASVIPQVQSREVEAEGAGLPAERVDEVARDRPGPVRPEARSDRVEVVDELPGRVVPARADVVDPVEPLDHEGQLLAVGLVGRALGHLLGHRREALAVGFEAGLECRREAEAVAVVAQCRSQRDEPVPVGREDEAALSFERIRGHAGRDERVAVAVAPRPRPEADERRDVVVGQSRAVERHPDRPVELGDDVEQRVLEVPVDVPNLVLGLGPSDADLSRVPEAGHLGLERRLEAIALVVGQAALVEGLEGLGDRPELRLDGLAPGLRRVGGERRLDHDVVEDPLDGPRIGRVELGDGGLDALGERPQLLAAPELADALALLGEVDQLEVRGERPGDDALEGRVEPRERRVELGPRFGVAAAVGDGGGPEPLDDLEGRRRGAGLEDVAEEGTQLTDVLSDAPVVQPHRPSVHGGTVKRSETP